MYHEIKRKVFNFFDHTNGGSTVKRAFHGFIIFLIVANVVVVIMETVPEFHAAHYLALHTFDVFSVAVFTVEYLIRLWVSNCNPKYRHPVWGRIRYMFSIGALIDLIAIVPFFLPMVTNFDLREIRLLRLFRFMRFFKLGRYLSASKVMSHVFQEKREELTLSFLLTSFLIIVASCIMYFIEHEAQPDRFSSIPASMWWSVSTLTTVGYGDMYPITPLGKTIASCISVLGIGLFALPAGILASGFSDEFKRRRHKRFCPHCGKELDQDSFTHPKS